MKYDPANQYSGVFGPPLIRSVLYSGPLFFPSVKSPDGEKFSCGFRLEENSDEVVELISQISLLPNAQTFVGNHAHIPVISTNFTRFTRITGALESDEVLAQLIFVIALPADSMDLMESFR